MIEIKNLTKKYDENVIFEDFSLNVDDGEFLMLTGPSGCGKTTMLNMIGALEPFDSGKIIVDGEDISIRRKQLNYFRNEVGFLFQNFALIENKTVEQNLEIIKRPCRSETGTLQALEKVGLSGDEGKKVFKLSGGEQQRLALARLMVKKCNLILADEPTGSLDRNNAIQVMEILKDLNKNGKTILMVTHDESLEIYADRVINL
jgi:putative ABC transport system ATP-binding protein